MATIAFRIDGVAYPLEIDETKGANSLSPREWGEIKRIAHVLPAQLAEAIEGGDMELMAALAIVAMRRAGGQPDVDAILDGRFPLEVEADAEADDDPPAVAADAADDKPTG
jgi:uncharacterized protein (DUF2336 family)